MIDEDQVLAKVAAANPVAATTSIGVQEQAEARRVLERVLSASESDRSPSGGRVRRRGGSVGWLVSALGVATALAVVVVALVSVGRHAGVSRHAGQRATAVPGRQQLIDLIAVLRRPQTTTDLEAEQLPFFKHPGLLALGGKPDLPLVRYATTTPWGERLFFIPLKPLTAAQQERIARRLRASLYEPLRGRRIGETLGVFSSQGGAGGGGAAAIEAGRFLQTEGAGGARNEGSPATRLILVVPDGVAKVTFVLPRQTDRLNPKEPTYAHRLSVTVAVHDNVAAVQVDRNCCTASPLPMIWYGAGGRVIKRIGNP